MNCIHCHRPVVEDYDGWAHFVPLGAVYRRYVHCDPYSWDTGVYLDNTRVAEGDIQVQIV